jgi:hypothetical protein
MEDFVPAISSRQFIRRGRSKPCSWVAVRSNLSLGATEDADIANKANGDMLAGLFVVGLKPEHVGDVQSSKKKKGAISTLPGHNLIIWARHSSGRQLLAG